MHIMEGECDKSGGLLTGERAPELLERTNSDEPKTVAVVNHPEATQVDKAALEADPEPSTELVLTNGDRPHTPTKQESEEDLKTLDNGDGSKSGEQESEMAEDGLEEKIGEKEESEDVNTKDAVDESPPLSEVLPKTENELLERVEDKVVNCQDSEHAPAEVLSASPEEKSSGKPAEGEDSRDSAPGSLSPSSRHNSPKLPSGEMELEDVSKASLRSETSSPVLAAASPPPSKPPSRASSVGLPASPLTGPAPSALHSLREESAAPLNDLKNNGPATAIVSITTPSESPSRKRSVEKEVEGEISSGSESDNGRKKVKMERDGESVSPHPPPEQQGYMDYERERLIQDFVTECSQRPEEMNRAADKLQKEVETLAELLKAKEMEWNTLLRLKKLKEETLERLMKRKRQALVEDLTNDRFLDHTTLKNALRNSSNQLMMVPIVSSSPTAMLNRAPPPMRMPDYGKFPNRPILPKPYAGMVDPSTGMREGRNGPVLDVKTIIADYRSRHPQDIPRRGRRVRGDPNLRNPSVNPSSLISMSNMALGSGARVRTLNESQYPHPNAVDQMRGGNADARSEAASAAGYKEVLAQFAKLTGGQPPPQGGVPAATKAGVSTAPPPPYPEVTLHPVGGRPPSPPTSSSSSSSSLLHGILTKSTPASRPSNFSPTLARLLTAPDRPPHPVPPPPYRPQPSSRVSINDIINSSKKSRNEITITPVPGNQPPTKPPKEEVVMADEDDGESGDRLVIDEGTEESPLQCQGCKQKSAQFVCAGCGNQWYCSRECQVTAWEDHSDVCSG